MSDSSSSPADFATTHWSIVLQAGRRDVDSRAALAALCERYWLPLYAYVRRRTGDVHEAQDLIQEFFTRLLEKNTLAAADPDRGRFRAFLLTAVKNFLANQADAARTKKRGGDANILSLDFAAGESRLRIEPREEATAESLYERQWVFTLLETVVGRLRAEAIAAGKERQFELLQGAVAGARDKLSYADLAAELQLSEDAVRQAASRLRKRYRELLRDEVAQTVADPRDVDEEIQRLFQTLSGA